MLTETIGVHHSQEREREREGRERGKIQHLNLLNHYKTKSYNSSKSLGNRHFQANYCGCISCKVPRSKRNRSANKTYKYDSKLPPMETLLRHKRKVTLVWAHLGLRRSCVNISRLFGICLRLLLGTFVRLKSYPIRKESTRPIQIVQQQQFRVLYIARMARTVLANTSRLSIRRKGW